MRQATKKGSASCNTIIRHKSVDKRYRKDCRSSIQRRGHSNEILKILKTPLYDGRDGGDDNDAHDGDDDDDNDDVVYDGYDSRS